MFAIIAMRAHTRTFKYYRRRERECYAPLIRPACYYFKQKSILTPVFYCTSMFITNAYPDTGAARKSASRRAPRVNSFICFASCRPRPPASRRPRSTFPSRTPFDSAHLFQTLCMSWYCISTGKLLRTRTINLYYSVVRIQLFLYAQYSFSTITIRMNYCLKTLTNYLYASPICTSIFQVVFIYYPFLWLTGALKFSRAFFTIFANKTLAVSSLESIRDF